MDYVKLEKSLEHLRLQYENYRRSEDRPEIAEIDREAIRESVINRFETCYDMVWKHCKKHLSQVLGLPDVPNSPKPVFRLAHENGLLTDIEQWMTYARARVETAHDYSYEKTVHSLRQIGSFIADAQSVYDRLSGET